MQTCHSIIPVLYPGLVSKRFPSSLSTKFLYVFYKILMRTVSFTHLIFLDLVNLQTLCRRNI
jgi:hypothetical protein